MAVSFKYWDDCVDNQDLDLMWNHPDVEAEWLEAGETRGSKVHLSRDPDGQPFLTQTEMRAVAGAIVRKHFVSQIDSDIKNTFEATIRFKLEKPEDMLCAIAELESDRRPLATVYNKKSKETMMGIMQISSKTAQWLFDDLGYKSYELSGGQKLLNKPFVNVYFSAAYLKWLSNYDQQERSEEFMVRAYKGGVKKATHKSTLQYWKRYLSVKETLPSRKVFEVGPLPNGSSTSASASAPAPAPASVPASNKEDPVKTTWDSRTSQEDMEEMWNNPSVSKEWIKSGEKKGNVRFSHDVEKRPYLSRVEVRAVSGIILSKHSSMKGVKPAILSAIAEIVSMRFVNGIGQRTGLMGIDYPTALWLYKDLGYTAYTVESVEDLTCPFISMYFGAAYLAWLSQYEGRERTLQFAVQAYMAGPQNVNLQETGPVWHKFEEALSHYEDTKKVESSCTIL